jgi:lipoprotein-anchoring transpeptidase ErfK/SrfK
MLRVFIATVVSSCLVVPALAARLDAAAINNAEYSAKLSTDSIEPAAIRIQVLLDRARFSPGEIDGKFGENAEKALKAFAEAKGLKPANALNEDVWKALVAGNADPAVVEYRIDDSDVKGPFLEKLPKKMENLKRLKAVGYTSPREAIAEKFHMSEGLLEALNPKKKFDRAGETLLVTNVPTGQPKLTIGRVEVDKSRQTVKAFGSKGELVGFFPATVGSEEKPTPDGSLKVVSSDANPVYRYNPDYKFKSVKSKSAFTIKPGPNNPVGSWWIGLSAEGIGIHGTAEPSKVSKSESHGCVRLTNWDAGLLGTNIRKGTPVVFVDQPQGDRKS